MEFRILIAEDDATLRDGLAQAFAGLGIDATLAASGERADLLLATRPFDLLVLDLGLPGMDGLDVLRRLRARTEHENVSIPVLILSARDSTEARVRGLDSGADDYLTKPFELSEFQARTRALLRRVRPTGFRIGRLEWDWSTRQGQVEGSTLALSRTETVFLEQLLRSPGRVIPKALLAGAIGDDGVAVDNKVEVYVHRLRRKLGEQAGVRIGNVRGLGYFIQASPA